MTLFRWTMAISFTIFVMTRSCSSQTVAVMPNVKTPCELVGIYPGDFIFVPENYTIESLIFNANSKISGSSFILSGVDPELSKPFLVGAVELVCDTYLRKVDAYAYESKGLGLPINVCRSTCEWSVELQTPYLNTIGIFYLGVGIYKDRQLIANNTTPLECDKWLTVDPYLHLYFSEYSYEGYNVSCKGISNFTISDVQKYFCPDPLVNTDPESVSCGYPAPPPPITHEQYDDISLLSFIMGLITVLLSIIFLSLSVMSYQVYYRYPGCFVVISVIYSGIGGMSFMGAQMTGIEKMWGGDGQFFKFVKPSSEVDAYGTSYFEIDTSSYIASSTWCYLQGFGIYISIPSVMIMTLMSMLAILFILYPKWVDRFYEALANDVLDRRFLRWINPRWFMNSMVILMVVPFIGAGTLAALDKLVLGPGSGYCGINPQDLYYLISFWVLPLVCIPLASLIVFVMILSTLLHHWYHHRDWPDKKNFFMVALRCGMVSFMNQMIGIICSALSIVSAIRTQNAKSQISDYLNCRVGVAGNECYLSDELYQINMVYVAFLNLHLMTYPSFGIMAQLINNKPIVRNFKRLLGRMGLMDYISSRGDVNSSSGGTMNVVVDMDCQDEMEYEEEEEDATSSESD